MRGPIVSTAAGRTAASPTVLVVGAASRDVTAADPRGWRLGGAVTYGSLMLARLGLQVRALVGADAAAAQAAELNLLRDAGVEVVIAALDRGPVFENLELPGGRRQRCVSVADEVDPSLLPPTWEGHDAMFLGPVAAELGAAWASVPTQFVALGWQGLLRRLVAGADVERLDPEPGPLLSRADLVGVSIHDVSSTARLSRLVDLVRPGATLVVTRGDRGGTVLTSHRPARSSLRAYPAIPSTAIVDATGAGDVFLATLVATMVDGPRLGADDWPDRLTFAAAAGSLAVEAPGILGVPTLAAIRRRVAEVA